MCFNAALRNLAVCVPVAQLKNISMHDHFIMSLCAMVGEIAYVDERLVKYRQHSKNEMGASAMTAGEKIKQNLADVFTGEFVRKKREFHKTERNLAKAMIMTFANQEEVALLEGQEMVLEALCGIEHETWARRRRFYRRNQFDRMKHTIWMRMWV